MLSWLGQPNTLTSVPKLAAKATVKIVAEQ
jgi:hypothetical protein